MFLFVIGGDGDEDFNRALDAFGSQHQGQEERMARRKASCASNGSLLNQLPLHLSDRQLHRGKNYWTPLQLRRSDQCHQGRLRPEDLD
jgi:hypothetical protein